MADRIFASIALLVVLGYGFIAFTSIRAPIQYDPLGPESWPRILAILAVFCCIWIFMRPDHEPFDLSRLTGLKVAVMVFALIVYAVLFEAAGFIISTALFCAVSVVLLGGTPLGAIIFGLSTGVIGYFIGVKLLVLNLPAGVLSSIL